MCPGCIGSATLVVGSVMSSGGLTALAVKIFRSKRTDSKNREQEQNSTNPSGKEK